MVAAEIPVVNAPKRTWAPMATLTIMLVFRAIGKPDRVKFDCDRARSVFLGAYLCFCIRAIRLVHAPGSAVTVHGPLLLPNVEVQNQFARVIQIKRQTLLTNPNDCFSPQLLVLLPCSAGPGNMGMGTSLST